MTGPDGLIFDLQRFSVHDGPGIRSTLFLKGCPLRCVWCHNPESQSASAELMVHAARCLRCGACAEACPTGAAGDPAIRCESCGRCVEVCPTGGREVAGRPIGVDEAVAELLRDRPFYEASGGGVTFSGGEPLSQPEFLRACLGACRTAGLHTALDTCGHAEPETFAAAARLADLVLFDVKVVDEARHLAVTGVSNALLLSNLRAVARWHPDLWIRVPVVPGVNDDEASMEAIASLAASLPRLRRVSLLPYHAWGAEKALRLGRQPAEPPRAELAPGALDHFAGTLVRAGLPVAVGG